MPAFGTTTATAEGISDFSDFLDCDLFGTSPSHHPKFGPTASASGYDDVDGLDLAFKLDPPGCGDLDFDFDRLLTQPEDGFRFDNGGSHGFKFFNPTLPFDGGIQGESLRMTDSSLHFLPSSAQSDHSTLSQSMPLDETQLGSANSSSNAEDRNFDSFKPSLQRQVFPPLDIQRSTASSHPHRSIPPNFLSTPATSTSPSLE